MTDDMIDVGALGDVPPLGARKIRTRLGCVAVFRAGDDRVFALRDRCPHNGGPLSDGIVHGASVTCPLHGWVIDLETGLAQGADSGAAETIACAVVAGRILVDAAALGLIAPQKAQDDPAAMLQGAA
ncbi:MAG: nitrite reductase (NAD(P)H) small subunit [Alphaproteobacteria bacterium]|nr:nitrite reductase (NAD(P)H) small subunit [Alphaproteobacteria bacterium]